jgi:tetratricopeptide (TPR) repeat protein
MQGALMAAIALMISIASTAASTEFDRPIPQDPQKMRWAQFDSYIWAEKTLSAPFEKIGKKNPRWDAAARKALDLACRCFGQQTDPVVTDDEVFKAVKVALDAGCDDPIILYLYAVTSTGRNLPDYNEQDIRNTAAAIALESSKYPPIRRAVMLIVAGRIKSYGVSPELRKEAARMFDAALALLAESIESDDINPSSRRIWQTALNVMIECLAMPSMLGDRKSAFDKVEASLAKVPAAKPISLVVRGKFLIESAWDARGVGSGNTVTEDGWRKFGERLEEARNTLKAAWELDPTDPEAATRMIIVEMGLGHGDRESMESWFLQAMEADGNNLTACENKLLWLEPKWHGTAEEMLEFGRECRQTRNWRSGIAFLLSDVHTRLADYLPREDQVKYYQKPEVWSELQSLYLEYLKEFPNDFVIKSEYAGFCYLCSQYDEAHAQFEKLGENLAPGRMFSEKWLKQTRYATADRVRGDQKPNTPPAKGFAVLHASYGARDSWVDVLKQARENEVGDHLKFSTNNLPDPMFGVVKNLVIAYSVDGKVGLALMPESREFILPPMEPARMSVVLAQGFAVLEARYGDGDKWVDVSDEFRKRTVDGKLDSSAADLPDPVFGTHKALVILYAWEGRIYLSITQDNLRISLPASYPDIKR